MSLDRAFFSEQSSIADPGSVSGESIVDVKDLTRLSFSLLAFPKPNNSLRPYGGVGVALNFIGNAEASGSGGSAFSAGAIENESSRASFQLLAGLQKQMRSMSLFGQIVMLPFETDFLLNGRAGFSLELGARWNVGGAIDKLH